MIHSLSVVEIVQTLLILALICLAYIDLQSFRLPDLITLPMLASGLIFNSFSNFRFTSTQNAITGAIGGYVFFWALNISYRWAKKQNGIGMGDAKLLAALGAWLGLTALPEILLMASIGGLIGGLLWLRYQKASIRSAFPFGPFLVIAGIIELLWPQLFQRLLLNYLI